MQRDAATAVQRERTPTRRVPAVQALLRGGDLLLELRVEQRGEMRGVGGIGGARSAALGAAPTPAALAAAALLAVTVAAVAVAVAVIFGNTLLVIAVGGGRARVARRRRRTARPRH
jgi:hypothetical protein